MSLLKRIITAIVTFFTKTGIEWALIRGDEPPPTVPPTVPPNVVPEPVETPPLVHPLLRYDWSTPKAARHSVRVICDEEGLSLARNVKVDGKLYQLKDILCACIMQESNFMNVYEDGAPVTNANYGMMSGQRVLWSTDWGIVQINDHYHIGPGKTFPSVEYVMANPDECVRWMARMFKAGKANLWSSYVSGAYKKWL